MADKPSKPEVPAKRPIGRPPIYSEELADKVLKEIAGGKSVLKTCAMPGMPARETVYQWKNNIPEFADKYAQAKRQCMETHIEDIIELADSATPETVNAVRLQVDTRKWLASKLMPKLYGDRLNVDAAVETKQEQIDVVQLARMILFGLRLAVEEQDKDKPKQIGGE